MLPIEFTGSNAVFGANQPQYRPLPALVIPGPDGEVITCYELTDDDIERLSKNRRIYFKQLTFNRGFNPIFPMVDLGDDIAMDMTKMPG